VDWPDGARPADVVRTLDASVPAHAALLDLAAELLRGAGYTAFDGAVPDQVGHAGVGAPYAHVTAPIRRLVDRFATEVCLAASAGDEVPSWAREALASLPELMAASNQRAGALERAILDQTEAWLLAPRVGQVFAAAVVEVDGEDDERATIVLDEPAVRARCDGAGPSLGARIEARLVEADPVTRQVRFTPA
jgi:exoribonuclease R